MLRTPLLALIVCAAAAAALADPIVLEPTRVRLNAEDRAQDSVGRLRFLGGLELRSTDPRFGGLSGLALGAAGRRLVAVSDAGFWFEAEILADDEGRLAGLENATLSPMRGRDGAPLEGKRAGDAEAVERLGDSAYIVAFERDHRLWRYDTAGGLAEANPFELGPPPGLESAPGNRGVEALAVLGENRLLAITEGALDPAGDLLGWLIEDGVASPLGYRLTPFFRPTDLAVLPSGEGQAARRVVIDVGSSYH